VASRAEARRDRRTEGGGGSSGKLIWILVGVGVLGVTLVLWNVFSTITDESARRPVDLVYSSPAQLIEMAQGISIGDPNAPVTLLEFADYQCPSCQAFWAQTKPFIDLGYVQTGKVRFVFHDFPLHENHLHAYLAARAGRCAAEQDSFWSYHDRLFQEQATWASRADPMNDFLSYAAGLGMNEGDFERCIKSDRHAQLVTANRVLGEQLGVTGTPSIFMDSGEGRPIRIENWSSAGVREALDAALDRVAARTAAAPAPEATP